MRLDFVGFLKIRALEIWVCLGFGRANETRGNTRFGVSFVSFLIFMPQMLHAQNAKIL